MATNSPNVPQSFPPVVSIIIVGTGLVAFARSMSLPFLAIFLNNMGVVPDQIGLLIGFGALVGGIGGPIGGWLSDVIGRKRVLLLALGFSIVGFVGLSCSYSVYQFFVFNIVVRLGSSLFEPVAKALISDNLLPDNRLRAFTRRYVAINAGVAVGPLAGAYASLWIGQVIFVVTAVLYTLFVAVLFRSFGLVGPKLNRSDNTTKISSHKCVVRLLATDMRLLLFTLGGLLSVSISGSMSVIFPQYLNSQFSYGVQLYGWLMTVNASTVICSQVFIGRISEALGPIKSLTAGTILQCIGLLFFSSIESPVYLIFGMILFAVGEVLMVPAEVILVDQIAPEANRGAYYGAHSLCNIGLLLGPWASGFLLVAFSSQAMFGSMAAGLLIGLCLFAAGRFLGSAPRKRN